MFNLSFNDAKSLVIKSPAGAWEKLNGTGWLLMRPAMSVIVNADGSVWKVSSKGTKLGEFHFPSDQAQCLIALLGIKR